MLWHFVLWISVDCWSLCLWVVLVGGRFECGFVTGCL